MKPHFLSILLALCVFNAFAQPAQVTLDSLKKVASQGNDREKFKALTMLSDRYSDNDLRQSMRYARQSLIIANRVANDTFKALANNSVANVYQYRSDIDSALLFHQKALQCRKKIRDGIGIADTYNNIGIAYDQQAQFPEALANYFSALRYYEKNSASPDKLAMTFTNIGIVYKEQKAYGKALGYYQKAYDAYLKTSDEFGKTVSAGNLGSIQLNFGNYNDAIKYSKLAESGYKKLHAERFLGYPISTIAAVYDSLHDFEQANRNYLEAIKLHESYANGFEVAENANALANCLIKQGQYAGSIAMALKAIDFAKASDAQLAEVQAYKILSKAHAMLGDFKEAYRYSNLYNTGKDSIFEAEKTKAVFELETRYQTAKKEKQLLANRAEARRKNYMLAAISVLAGCIGLIGFLIFRQQKIKNRQQEQEFQLQSAIAQIETQNQLQEQRLSISRDLHDNIGAQLTFIISSVDSIKYAFDIGNERLDSKLKSISNFAKSTIVELRDTIWAMNANALTFEDLRARILNFIEKAKDAKEHIEFEFTIDDALGKEQLSSLSGMNIYRTIQEAVNNSIKYAEASKIAIDVSRIADKITITVTDNGIGFDPSAIEKGNGLLNMQKRIEDIGGIFSLASQFRNGTVITILLKLSR